jgi:hypothetical protein
MKKNSMCINYCAVCRVLLLTISVSVLLVFGPRQSGAADQAGLSAQEGDKVQGQSPTEINKQLSNPVSNVWSLSFQQNNYYLHNPHRWQSNLQFQPVLPVALTKDWNLITRPVFQFFNSTPYPSVRMSRPTPGKPLVIPKVHINRTTGYGDTILMEMLTPRYSICCRRQSRQGEFHPPERTEPFPGTALPQDRPPCPGDHPGCNCLGSGFSS